MLRNSVRMHASLQFKTGQPRRSVKIIAILGIYCENDFMQNLSQSVPRLHGLPISLSRPGAIEIELEEGVLIFRVSPTVQERINDLVDRQRAASLNDFEETELNQYEEIDDYLSFLNRLTRNLAESPSEDLGIAS